MAQGNPAKSKQIWLLNMLKSIFIISVVIIHCNSYIKLGITRFVIFRYFIELAVPFFMIISGFTFSLSMRKHSRISEWYRKSVIIPKLMRFVVPILVTALVFLVLIVIDGKEGEKLNAVTFLSCSFGPGGYYFLLMIEALLIFPLIYACVHKLRTKGLLLLFVLNLLFEAAVTLSGMDQLIYSRLILRFTAFLGAGVWIFEEKDDLNRNKVIFCVVSMLLGGAWIFATRYTSFDSFVFRGRIIYALPVLLWCGPIIYAAIRCFGSAEPKNRIVYNFFNVTGKASFHILSVQMILFDGVSVAEKLIGNKVLLSFVFLAASLGLGSVFWLIDSKFQSIINKKLFRAGYSSKTAEKSR